MLQTFKYLNTKLGAVIALFVSLLMAARALGTSLLPGSAPAAQEFTQLISDPIQKLKTRFNLINRIKQRCQFLSMSLTDVERAIQ
jgi:hypothetical protein